MAPASFIVGTAAAGRVLRTASPGWSGRCTGLLGTVGPLLAAAAPGLAVNGGQPLAPAR